MHILIVDDHADLQVLLTLILEEAGYTVISAANGRDALMYLHHTSELLGLILLDIAMPLMSGTEFLREQQRDPLLAAIPVVLLTARDSFDHEAAACVVATLHKPINLDTLLATVREYAALSLSNA
jgi:CheY-like chemotaxis protein